MTFRTVAALALATLLVAGCKAKETGPDAADTKDAVPAVATPVPAATEDPDATAPLASFDGRDADHDGELTSAEQSLAAQKIFAAIDADGDGAITVVEMDAGGQALGFASDPSSEKRIASADNDRDGKLTLAEWVASSNAEFGKADANKDGVISRAEWEARNQTAEKTADGAALVPAPSPTK